MPDSETTGLTENTNPASTVVFPAQSADGNNDYRVPYSAWEADFQPLDSDLTAIAALTTTAYGRAFLALADAPAGRTALGLGTAALSASGDFQPVDSDLTAIAALTTTSYGRSVLAAADATALRVIAGVVIGTDVQAYDADLSAIAALTSAANKMPYSTGSGTWALTDLTAAARTLLASVTAANIPIVDTAADFDATDVEGALAELQTQHEALPTLAVTDDLTLSGGTVGRSATDVQVFIASGTWTKPAGATAVHVMVVAGGGAGGSGRKGAAGSARCGGGGGQGGHVSEAWFQAASCGATETVTVGAGATGAAAQTTNGTDGVAGASGGNSSFGSLLLASGGLGGGAGSATIGYGGGSPNQIVAGLTSTRRGSYRNEGAGDTSIIGTPTTPLGGHVGSGGGGGGIDSLNVARGGGASSGGAGAANAAAVAAGANGTAATAATGISGGGGGGGGGAASGGTVGAGAAGGNYGGGGGGGGAGIDSVNNSGAGGTGAGGYVIVVTFH